MKIVKKLFGKSDFSMLKSNPHLNFLVKNTNVPESPDKKFSDFKWPVFRNARFD